MAITNIDEQKLEAFVGHVATELGAALNAALVTLGDELGLYRAMADGQPVTAGRARRAHRHAGALRARVAQRPGRERLRRLRPGDATPTCCRPSTRSSSPTTRARVVDDRRLPGRERRRRGPRAARRALRQRRGRRLARAPPRPLARHRARRSRSTTARTSWPSGCPRSTASSRSSRPAALVADVGCGHGASTILMAEAFPASRFVGIDYHAASIATARERAEEAGVADRVTLRGRRRGGATGARATTSWPSSTRSTTSATRSARRARAAAALAPGGTCLLVEPYAGDRVEDNLNPVGRLYYGFSTLVCTPGSLSQPGRAGLGTQAGEARLREALQAGGFGHGPARRRDAAEPRPRGAAAVTANPRSAPARRRPAMSFGRGPVKPSSKTSRTPGAER